MDGKLNFSDEDETNKTAGKKLYSTIQMNNDLIENEDDLTENKDDINHLLLEGIDSITYLVDSIRFKLPFCIQYRKQFFESKVGL